VEGLVEQGHRGECIKPIANHVLTDVLGDIEFSTTIAWTENTAIPLSLLEGGGDESCALFKERREQRFRQPFYTESVSEDLPNNVKIDRGAS
jgi:hypothetical protein